MPLRYFVLVLAAVARRGDCCWRVTASYRLQRLTTFLHPFQDAQGSRIPHRRGPLRSRLRRHLRRRPRPGHVQVRLGAQRQLRLRVRGHRRGARPARLLWRCCCCSGCSPTPACGWRGAAPIRSSGSPPARRRSGCAGRPSSTSDTSPACCRSPASRCRSSPPAGRRCSHRSSCWGCWCPSPDTSRPRSPQREGRAPWHAEQAGAVVAPARAASLRAAEATPPCVAAQQSAHRAARADRDSAADRRAARGAAAAPDRRLDGGGPVAPCATIGTARVSLVGARSGARTPMSCRGAASSWPGGTRPGTSSRR